MKLSTIKLKRGCKQT